MAQETVFRMDLTHLSMGSTHGAGGGEWPIGTLQPPITSDLFTVLHDACEKTNILH